MLPQFRKQLAVAALNALAKDLDATDTSTGWVSDAITSPDAAPEALQAYVTVNSGTKGIWIQPIVPPDSDCVSEQLAALTYAMAGGRDRPIYVCVRSYQAWLESILEDLGAQAGPRQAVMVRRLAKLQKVEEKISAMDKVLVKPTAPVARVVTNQEIPPKE